jgi:hypothetical protein
LEGDEEVCVRKGGFTTEGGEEWKKIENGKWKVKGLTQR